MKKLFPALALFLAVACARPTVVPLQQDPAFRLPMLREQRVAVWPIAFANLDADVATTVLKEYADRNAFLDALSGKLATKVCGAAKAGSLDAKAIQTAFSKEDLKRWLDPSQVLSGVDLNARFGEASAPAFAPLSKLPALQGVRFLLIPRGMSLGRIIHTQPGQWVSTGAPGGGQVYRAGSTSASSEANVQLAIVDLERGRLVWDGTIAASASSLFLKATALHEIEDELVQNLGNAIQGIE